MARRWGALCLLACVAAAPAAAPEPQGYWTGPVHGAVPATIKGGAVIHTAALAQLLERHKAILIDVAAAPRRPAGIPPGAPWLPIAHRDIPDSTWIPYAGSDALAALFNRRLDQLTHHDTEMPVVVYCHPLCWTSWNAARRAIQDGYRQVYWYPDGIEGWTAAGYPSAAVTAEQ